MRRVRGVGGMGVWLGPLTILLLAGRTVALGEEEEVEEGKPAGDETVGGHGKKVVCYWGTWANYRPKEGKFTPDSVDGSLCTHLIYSFAGLDAAKSGIKSLDTWMDLEKDYGLAGFRKATDLRKTWPHLKVMIAIGGWNEGSTKYSAMAKDSKKRAKFVNSTLDFLQKHSFDGLDLDWEYPAKRGGATQDKKNFILLVKELKEAFTPHKYLLTAAIGAGKATIDISYDVAEMYKYLDLVNVMGYDYHGKWDKRTGHNAPLRPRPDETGGNLFLNLEYTVNYLLKLGAKPEKTVLGVPLYGRSFLLQNKANNGMGAPARSTSFAGPITREAGFLGYNEICKELTTPNSNWTVVWEPCHQAPFMVRGDRWVSYDDEHSVRLKAEFAADMELGGVMVWSVETDDFKGLCSNATIKYPLLRTLNSALSRKGRGEVPPEEEEECDPENYASPVSVSTTPYTGEGSSWETGDAHPTPSPAAPAALGPGSSPVCVKPNEPNPDLTDCSQFYLCAAGVPHLISCRPGTLYSAALMTCDHAANVDCQPQEKPQEEEDGEEDEEEEVKEKTPLGPGERPNIALPTSAPRTPRPRTTVITLAPAKSTIRTVPTVGTVPTVPTAPARPPTTRRTTTTWRTTLRPRPPITPKDETPLEEVDNHLDNYYTQYQSSDTLRRHNSRKTEEVGMSAEKVVIIFLVLALLLVFAVLAWCFRSKIREFSEPYLDNWQQKARKPSTVGLLAAYKLNKIPWPQKAEATAPAPPPKDYRSGAGRLPGGGYSAGAGSLYSPGGGFASSPAPPTPPRDYTAAPAVSRTTISLPYSGAPGLQPYTLSSRPRAAIPGEEATYCEIPAHTQKPEAPPRRKRSVTENTSEV